MNKSILWLVIFSSPGYSAVMADALNTCVGEYLGQANGQFEVVVTQAGYRVGVDRMTALYVDEATYVDNPGVTAYRTVYFPTPDCTGLALTSKDIPPGSVFPVATGVLYYVPQYSLTSVDDIQSRYVNGVCAAYPVVGYVGYLSYQNNVFITGVRENLIPPLHVSTSCLMPSSE